MSLRRTLQLSVALLVGCLALASASAAGAVDNPDYTAPPPTTVVSATTTPRIARVQRITTAAAVPSRQRMPITGADVTQLALVGGLLLLAGSSLLLIRRRSLS
jgi:LPXTG-motif cell wall-anchored protein